MAMATPDNPSSSASARSTASTTADSYIGSLISLTSKSEIRYEGVLYNINTDESSIGLKNVRSFGTEGRKKDGPQVPPSDKVYEYILFRGSDVKDLQVKSSPPVPSPATINNDPAIIQSHYPRPVSTSTSLPTAASGPSPDTISNTPQMSLPGSNFPGGLPLYPPGGNLGSWGASPAPNAGGSGLAMPLYWQGYYPPPNGLTHMPRQSLLRPPPGLQMPSLQQPIPMQYPGFNTSFPTGASNFPGSLPEYPSPLFTPNSSSFSTTSSSSAPLPLNFTPSAPTTIPSSITPIPSATPSSDTLPISMPHKAPATPLPLVSDSSNFMSLPPLTNATPTNVLAPLVTTKPNPVADPTLQLQSTSRRASSIMGPPDSANAETAKIALQTPTPSLITPGHLLQSGSSAIPSSQPLQAAHKDVEVVQVSPSSPKPLASVNADSQPPILPLPPQARPIDRNGAPFQSRYGYRGRDRGRGGRVQTSHQVTKFTEDFDFMAMNEKFKKDEVWGHLGKSNNRQSKDKDSDGDLTEEENFHDGNELSKVGVKPVYNKDDFFDSLSCNALDRDSQNGRTRLSEQMKLDTETFGEFSRYRGGQFGRGMNRGGGRTRGYYGRGYSYGNGRGRGRGTYTRPL